MIILYGIDDDPTMRRVYATLFKPSLGYTTYLFRDGEVALETMEYNTPDVAIVDLCMPYMDGYAVADGIKRLHPECTIIISTGLDGEQHRIAAESQGYKYWHKSSNYGELQGMVRTCQKKQ